MHEAPPHAEELLATLAAALLVGLLIGAFNGWRRGPLRQLAALAALAAAALIGGTIGADLGHALFDDTAVPWILRGAAGALLSGAITWLIVYILVRRRSPAPKTLGGADRPVLGALVGSLTALTWFALGLFPILVLGAVGEIIRGDPAAPHRTAFPLRAAVHLRAALASTALTAPVAAFDPLPPRLRRTLTCGLAVLRNKAALARFRSDEEVRALAAHPAFYPLVNDPEINTLLKRHDIEGLLAHPRVSALLADDDFQRRLAGADLNRMLTRALEQKGDGAH